MTSLTDFPIFSAWPAQNPDIIQLFSYPTPNGVKISIALEEMGLDYEVHKIKLFEDTNKPAFLSLNPNNKIPALIDPHGPDGQPVALFESGAILIYLAEKSGKLLPTDAKSKFETIQWLMFQIGGVGPMFGQLGYFSKFAGAEIEDPRPRERYVSEAKRLLGVIEKQLQGRDWITGAYSIADIAIAPWLRGIATYGAADAVGWDQFKNTQAYLDRFLARPAVQVGLVTPPPN